VAGKGCVGSTSSKAPVAQGLVIPMPVSSHSNARSRFCHTLLHPAKNACTTPTVPPLYCSAGRTRLLYRMSLDFLHWTKAVPGIDKFWRNIAGQVSWRVGKRRGRAGNLLVEWVGGEATAASSGPGWLSSICTLCFIGPGPASAAF